MPTDRQLKGDTTMTTTGKVLLSAVICLCTAAQALAAHHDRTHKDGQSPQPGVYASSSNCSASKQTNPSRMQPGETAIMIQDRFYRESVGVPFDNGECW
jgi:hypothetical protein